MIGFAELRKHWTNLQWRDGGFAGPFVPHSGESWRSAPWHRSPSCDLCRAPYDYPDLPATRPARICSAFP